MEMTDQPARERFRELVHALTLHARKYGGSLHNTNDWDAMLMAERAVLDAYDEHHAQPAAPVCGTCGGHGVVGYASGQTPGSYEEGERPCPDCTDPDETAFEKLLDDYVRAYTTAYDHHESAAFVPPKRAAVINAWRNRREQPPAQSEREAWQPIETAPKEGRILAHGPWSLSPRIVYWMGDIDTTQDGWSVFPSPTHWQPLPEPPR